MTTSDAYARLLQLRLPVLTTGDVAAALRLSKSAASMVLARLAASGLATKIRHGQWALGTSSVSRYSIVESLTAPMPSYLSLQTGLYLRGLIEQVPVTVYVVSLAKTQRIKTPLATYSIHHIVPQLFDGFETRADGTKLASVEKALFDMAYFSSARSRLFAYTPELELPARIRETKLRLWTSRIASAQRRSMVEKRLQQMFAHASRG